MPEALERKLKAMARKHGLGKKRTGAYVYGTMNKMREMPSEKEMRTAMKKRLKKA